jgi:hypothetical protein
MKLNILIFAYSISCLIAASTKAQVPGYVPTNNLVAWYSFNNNVNDLSGNNNTPTNSGATFVSDRFGNANSALDFNGTNAVMTLSTASFKFSETGEYTYSVWLNKRTQSSSAVVIMNGINTPGNFISNIQGQDSTQAGVNKQQSSWAWATCSHNLNTWDHYVAVYNASVLTLYKNGVSCSSVNYTHSGAASAFMPLYFGRGLQGSSNYYNGSMDEIGIWDRALSQQEITSLYSASVGQKEIIIEKHLFIFPNPTFDFITVKINPAHIGTGYIIMDKTGRRVMYGKLQDAQSPINIQGLAAGEYILKIDNGSEESFFIGKN